MNKEKPKPAKKAKSSKRVTILDIANKAEVSPATVSRVLNNVDYPISAELRSRVQSVAKELDYKPNIIGQMLRGISSKEIGIIVPDLANPFYSQLVSTVAKKCVDKGYAPIVSCSFNSSEMEERQIEILLRQQVAGIILSILSEIDDFLEKYEEPGAPPIVLFDQIHKGFNGDSIYFDFRKGGYLAVKHLVETGHKRIAFASNIFDRSSRRQVFSGYQAALEEANIPFEKNLVLISSTAELPDSEEDKDFLNGRILGNMVSNLSKLPDAVMAINDITAIGIMDSLVNNDIKVPEDISIMGFDNIPLASMVNPRLSTVNQPANKTGRKAAEILFQRINHPEMPAQKVMIEPTLILRQSTKQ